jgi:hypothetical protein
MQLDAHVEAIRTELAALASLGDEHVAAAAERLSEALGPALEVRLLELLSEAALEIGSQLPAGQVEIRLAGHEPSLVYVEREDAPPPPAAEDALSARVTLRLPDSLKAAVEAAAARDGVSLNTWIVKALARGLSSVVAGRVGNRLTGYGRS